MDKTMLKWKTYKLYDDVKDITQCLYVFKKGHRYLYIGKAKKFGGVGGRYNAGYSHLISTLFEAGVTLRIARLNNAQWARVDDYENTLIVSTKGQKALNKKTSTSFKPVRDLSLP